jgi:glycine cleavage system H lipoate-binding protein
MVALFVLAAFIFFIALDFVVLAIQGKTHPAFEKVLSLSGLTILPEMEIKVPRDVVLSKGHVWMKKNKSGIVKLGTDEFVNKALGNIAIHNDLSIGKELKRGDVIFEGTVGNRKLKFRSPVSGIVNSINSNSVDSEYPDIYSNWSVELSSGKFTNDKGLFFSGSSALDWLKKEFIKLDDFLKVYSVKPELAGVTMYDGGKVIEGASIEVIKNITEDFEKEFLSL